MSLCQRNLSVTGADFERTGRVALKLDDGACREKKGAWVIYVEPRVYGSSEEQKREKKRGLRSL